MVIKHTPAPGTVPYQPLPRLTMPCYFECGGADQIWFRDERNHEGKGFIVYVCGGCGVEIPRTLKDAPACVISDDEVEKLAQEADQIKEWLEE
jgi:hypothetical protein